jgi:hypothetical protein
MVDRHDGNDHAAVDGHDGNGESGYRSRRQSMVDGTVTTGAAAILTYLPAHSRP